MKKWLGNTSMAVALALVAGSVNLSPAQAFEVKLSGQVNALVMFADNGFNTDFFIADNDNSSTRFRMTGDEELSNVKVGFILEFEAQRNASNLLDINQNDDGIFQFNERWLEGHFSGSWGKFGIGKGSGAADNTSEVDLSGTAVIMYSAITDTAGGITWTFKDGTKITRTEPLTGATITVDVGDTRDNFDGLGRNVRIRYDTPELAGFGLAASVTNGTAWEFAARYAGAIAEQKLAAAVGYVDTGDRDVAGQRDYQQIGASASWLAPIGLNVTASGGLRKFQGALKQARLAAGNTDNSKNYYLKVGWKGGIHAAALEWGRTDDLDQSGDESTNLGGSYVMIPWQGVEFYAAVRNLSLDQQGGPDPEDIRQIMAGTRIKF